MHAQTRIWANRLITIYGFGKKTYNWIGTKWHTHNGNDSFEFSCSRSLKQNTHRKRSTKNMHQPNSVRLKSWICTTRPKTIPKLGKIKQETHIKCIVIGVLCFLLLLLIRVFWRLHFVAKWSSFLNLSEKKGQLNALIYSVLPTYHGDKKVHER